MKFEINNKEDALVVVDMQNDFFDKVLNETTGELERGALGVDGATEIMPGISEVSKQFKTVILTQDYHPRGHVSFASSHEGKDPFDVIGLTYGHQVLWPDHCLQNDKSSEFVSGMHKLGVFGRATAIIRKGMSKNLDSYSAFYENDHTTQTGLGGMLKGLGVKRVFFVGLAYDFCVGWSAIDAKSRVGLKSVVLKDLCRSIKQPKVVTPSNPFKDSEAEIEDRFYSLGVRVASSDDIIPPL